MTQRKPTTLIVAGGAEALARLQPLITAHRRFRPVRTVALSSFSSNDLDGAAAVLIAGDAATDQPFLQAQNGRRVAAGWIPDVANRLEIFARAAAEVQLRCADGNNGPFVVLGEAEERALALAGRLSEALAKTTPAFQWSAERITHSDLTAALQLGVGAAFYVGRGAVQGWAGYGGFDAADLKRACGIPIGAVLSLTCSVARRDRQILSFCEEMVLSGLAGAAFGAADYTLHTSNVRLGLSMARALHGNVRTLADLLVSPEIPPETLMHYRIVGDPLAPLIGHPHSLARARQVFAPAPDEVLPEIPLSSWA